MNFLYILNRLGKVGDLNIEFFRTDDPLNFEFKDKRRGYDGFLKLEKSSLPVEDIYKSLCLLGGKYKGQNYRVNDRIMTFNDKERDFIIMSGFLSIVNELVILPGVYVAIDSVYYCHQEYYLRWIDFEDLRKIKDKVICNFKVEEKSWD